MANIIELHNYSFWAPENETQLLFDIDLEIKQGEFVIILGPSGAGKSILSQCMTGIYPNVLGGRAAGTARISDLDVIATPVPQLATHVGLIFQDPDSQFCNLFVGEEVAFGPENLLVPRDEVMRRKQESLKQVGLEGFELRFINELSGGQKQRVAIASVLAMGPEALILDQPTANLDPVGKNEVYELLYRLNIEKGKTIVLIEHQVDELIKIATRLVLMKNGRIIANDTPRQVLKEWARRLESEMGLWVPEIARLALLSEDLGYPMNPFPIDIEEATKIWMSLPISQNEALYHPPVTTESVHEDTLFKVDDLSFSYPTGFNALRNISLEIKTSETVGLMGENGSGKTTLSRHFIGLLKPSSGKIFLEGKDTTLVKIKSLAKDVGYVFQYPEHQFIADTVYDEIAYTPRLEKKSKSEIDRIVRETLNQVGLEGIDTRHPLSLSMGEKRRLSIATMLVRNPKMLILDEPTAGLDYRNTLRLMELLMGLKAKQTAIMLVTHTTFLVARYVQTVMVLEKGEMVFNGTPRDLFTHLDEVRTQSIDYPEMIKIVNEINKNQERKMFPFLSVDELRSVLMPVKGQ